MINAIEIPELNIYVAQLPENACHQQRMDLGALYGFVWACSLDILSLANQDQLVSAVRSYQERWP